MVKFHIFFILTFDGREWSTYASTILSLGRAYHSALNTVLSGPQIQSEHDNEVVGSQHTCCSPQPVAYDMCCGTLGDVNEFNYLLSLFCFVCFINGVLIFQFAYQAGNSDFSPFTINYF